MLGAPAATASPGAVPYDPSGRVRHVVRRHARDRLGRVRRASSPCRTIGQAVTNAAPGNRVKVLRGTYPEMVTVRKPLTLTGNDATIDATGKDNGVLVGPGASGRG